MSNEVTIRFEVGQPEPNLTILLGEVLALVQKHNRATENIGVHVEDEYYTGNVYTVTTTQHALELDSELRQRRAKQAEREAEYQREREAKRAEEATAE